MKVSVIIPIYNEERYISRCLESVTKQTLTPDEIILVDDGSTDNSISNIKYLPAMLRKAMQTGQIANSKLKFKILKQKHQGVAAARNFGAKRAAGNILIFLDADMVYDKNYLKELNKPLTGVKEIAATSSSEFVANSDNLWAEFWDKVTFNNRGCRIISAGDRDGTFRAIKAEYFRKAGGYASFGVSDDTSVLAKLNRTAKCIRTAVCFHFNPETLSEVFFSARWMGRDKVNKNQFVKLAIFSFPWSLVKAISGSIRYRDGRFLPFRLVFDWGYFLGLFDVNFRNIHYK